MVDFTDRNSGVIISAEASDPLLYAQRCEPVDPADSGWQFSSHPLGGGDPDDAQIWAVHEVLTREPSLRRFIDLPRGAILRRSFDGDEWQVAVIEP